MGSGTNAMYVGNILIHPMETVEVVHAQSGGRVCGLEFYLDGLDAGFGAPCPRHLFVTNDVFKVDGAVTHLNDVIVSPSARRLGHLVKLYRQGAPNSELIDVMCRAAR